MSGSIPAGEHRREITALAAALFGLIVGIRFAVDDPDVLVALLLVIPIALIAIEYGRLGGLAAALVCVLVIVAWAEGRGVRLPLVGYASRLVVFVVLGGSLGHLAELRARATAETTRWFEMSNDMLATASLDGYFTRLNASWKRHLGHTQRELMRRPYVELIHPDDVSSTLEAAGSLAAGPSEVVGFENRYRAKDGSWHWLL